MPPRSSKKADTKREGSSAKRSAMRAVERAAKKEAEREAMRKWIDDHDPLLDKAPTHPITINCIFDKMLMHKSFSHTSPGCEVKQEPYDWSVFQSVLESRNSSSRRWFIQLREEDLLAGEDGMDGVTVDCFVIAEASEPTLAPAEYIVKVHWPYSDAEDNTPERILPIEGQSMCWRRIVKSDGQDINAYLLVKKEGSSGSALTASPSSAAPASLFGMSAASAPNTASGSTASATLASTSAPVSGFGFSFGQSSSASTAPPSSSTATPPGFSFGFGTAPPTQGVTTTGSSNATTGIAFGFSNTVQSTSPQPGVPSASFGFGAANTTSGSTPVVDESAVAVKPLKPSEVFFTLWSKARVQEMAREIKSGSRIVHDSFILKTPTGSGLKMKLVMENDRKDKVEETTRHLILTRLFSKQDPEVVAIVQWIDACPVFDETLAAGLQAFRKRYVNQLASRSDLFESLFDAYHAQIQEELERIVAIRAKAAQSELDKIDYIIKQLKEGKLAEKSTFRLLKYYPKNDVQKFRPFKKIGGISEMGEYADVCEPPAHENINPFTGKPM
ncbi:unnamed protein product [Phytomonas sp. EM1]|nr:unnamed protein product [Phytomonas sp. EM1]|eukprot:CCW60897.1 unnamed protein product [Phytomonas sp. isolate EM1]